MRAVRSAASDTLVVGASVGVVLAAGSCLAVLAAFFMLPKLAHTAKEHDRELLSILLLCGVFMFGTIELELLEPDSITCPLRWLPALPLTIALAAIWVKHQRMLTVCLSASLWIVSDSDCTLSANRSSAVAFAASACRKPGASCGWRVRPR